MLMLLLSKSLIDQPVLSLRTGRQVAHTYSAIINPNNLKIEGFFCTDSLNKKLVLILLTQDIREVIGAGLVVNDHDVLAHPDDLVRLKKTIDINYELKNKPVFNEQKKRLGKINDYACDSTSLYVKKLYVGQSLLKNFTTGSLSVDRSQIVEVTNRKIVIRDPLQPTKITTANVTMTAAAAS